MALIIQMATPQCGHLPCEDLVDVLVVLNDQLAAFNPELYRRLRSDLQHFTDLELYQHWLMSLTRLDLPPL